MVRREVAEDVQISEGKQIRIEKSRMANIVLLLCGCAVIHDGSHTRGIENPLHSPGILLRGRSSIRSCHFLLSYKTSQTTVVEKISVEEKLACLLIT